MSFNYPRSGMNNVGEYQTSGLPWLSSAVVTTTPWRIDFPQVTNNISIQVSGALGNLVRFGVTQNGVQGTNYAGIDSGDGWVSFDIRTKTIFLRADQGTAGVSIMAGLTTILWAGFPVITASATYNSTNAEFAIAYGLPGTPGAGGGIG